MKVLEYAVEIGSTNTCIYSRGNGIVLREPSLIAINSSGKKLIVKAVGKDAKKMLGKTAGSVSVVKPVNKGIVLEEKTAGLMLKTFLSKVVPDSILKPKIKIVFCVPCGITEEEKAALKNIALFSGASSVEFIPIVVAALSGEGVKVSSSKANMVVNIGGGTCNVGVVSLNSIISGHTLSIGGETIDEAIQKYVARHLRLQVSKQTAKKVKEAIGSLFVNDTSNTEASGLSMDSKMAKTDVISASEIREPIEFYFRKVSEMIEEVLNSSNPDVITDIANNGIYITGAMAYITGLENYLKRRLRVPIHVAKYPEDSVILGAGKLLSDKKTLKAVIKEN